MADDLGDIVHGILNPTRWNRQVGQARDKIPPFGAVVEKFVCVTDRRARYLPYPKPDDYPTHGLPFVEQDRDIFKFIQRRDGEHFATGITEVHSAAELKRAAFRAKPGGSETGCESLRSIEEWLQKVFGDVGRETN